MKKIMLVTLTIVTLFALVACNTNNETTSTTSETKLSKTTSNASEVKLSETTSNVSEVKSSETANEVIPEEIVKETFAQDFFYTNDSVVYELNNAYYNEAGGIIVEGHIVNVTDHVAGTMRLKKLEIFNESDELIASNAFGYIQENWGAVYAGEKLEVSFTFPSINVYLKDENLDSVKSVSSFTSEH